MAYNEYAVPSLVSRSEFAVPDASPAIDANISKYAGYFMVAAMFYLLIIEKNIALFAVLFLMLSIFYNPTKFTMNGTIYRDSDVIL